MTPAKTTNRPKSFDQLRKQIDVDPARRANVEKHKAALLGELRRRLDLTQAVVADRLDVKGQGKRPRQATPDLRPSQTSRIGSSTARPRRFDRYGSCRRGLVTLGGLDPLARGGLEDLLIE